MWRIYPTWNPNDMPDPARPVPDEFLVAFSFAGEQRSLVNEIAGEVERRLGWGTVFYDGWYEHYLAGVDADLKLQDIYGSRCVLAVVCVSKRYGEKPWTKAEHRAVRARLMESYDPANPRSSDCMLPIRVGEGEVPGIPFNTIAPDVRIEVRDAKESATLIVDRLRTIAPQRVPASTQAGSDRPATTHKPLNVPQIENLHYLCNRDEQIGALDLFFGGAKREDFRRPVLVVVHGSAGAAHAAFLERLCEHELPGRFKRLGFSGGLQRAQPPQWLTAKDSASLANQLRQKITKELQFETACSDDGQLMECFRQTRCAVIAPVFEFSSREAFVGTQCYVPMLRDYWSQFPDLPIGIAVVCFLCVKYVDAPPGGFLARMFSGKNSQPMMQLRNIISQLVSDSDPSGVRVIHKVLDELGPVSPEDVERWFNHPTVSRVVSKRLHDVAIQTTIFSGKPSLPMEQVLDALEKFLSD